MKPLGLRRRLFAAILGLLSAMSSIGVSDARGDAGGLDVVILVDVSRSMLVGDKTNPVGNDPDRLRWDAVKLVLDLLTEDDRLLVLPFNDKCPAESPAVTRRPVPRFSGEHGLRYLDAGRRQNMAAEIESFIHKNETPNTDDGGTGILGALGETARHLDQARRADGRVAEPRPQVVLLLTDGKQDIGAEDTPAMDGKPGIHDTEDDKLVHEPGGKWRFDVRVKYFAEHKVRVFTYGLGPAADMPFLTELAQLAGGSSLKVENNTQLVAEFRRLIWSLRDCWTKRMNLKAGDSSSESLEGIIDLGILTSEIPAQPADPKRPSIAPSPRPKLTWLPGGAEPRATTRTGKVIDGQPSGYEYSYFDGRQRQGEKIGKYFSDHKGVEVLVGLDAAAQRNSEGFFVKRVPIRFVPQLADRPFFRNEPIPLAVELQGDTTLFPPENYVVTATLARNGSTVSKAGLARVTSTLTLRSRPDSPTPVFTAGADFTALALLGANEKVTTRIELYDLIIHVEEKPRDGAGDDSFRWEADLPTQIVKIDNTIPLAEVTPAPVLTRRSPEIDLSVKTAWPLPDRRLQLKIETTLPRRADSLKPLTGETIRFLSNGLVLNPSAVMQGGVLPIKAALPSDERKWPEPGPFSTGGRIVVTCNDPSDLKIATRRADGVVDVSESDGVSGHRFVSSFGLRLGTIGVHLEPKEDDLVVGAGKPAGERRIIVSTTDDEPGGVGAPAEPKGTSALKLRLFLEPVDAEQVKFDATELSVHAAKEPDRRGASVDVKVPREGMVVRFQPDPAKHADHRKLVGSHRYRLRAEGVGYNPAELELTLRVEPPRLEIQPAATSLAHQAPGTTAKIAQRVRMQWLAGGALEFSCQPADRLVVYDSESTSPIQRDSSELPFQVAPSGPWVLSAFTPPDPSDATSESEGWTTLQFAVRIPQEVRRGRYDGALGMRFEGTDAGRLKFGFLFDGLKTSGRLIPAAKLAEFVAEGANPEQLALRPTGRFDFTCCFDQPSTLQFVVGSHVGRLPLDPKLLEVAFEDRIGSIAVLRRAGSKRDYVVAPRPVVRGVSADQVGAVIELQFPEVANASPGEAYSGKLSVKYRGEGQPIDLGATEIELNVRFFEAAETVRVSGPKP